MRCKNCSFVVRNPSGKTCWEEKQLCGRCYRGLAPRRPPTKSKLDIVVTWDQEDYDTDSYHDNVTNNTRFTIPAGLGVRNARTWEIRNK